MGLFLIPAGTEHSAIWLPFFHHDNLQLAKSATHSTVSPATVPTPIDLLDPPYHKQPPPEQ
jgi:hypothetical protein